jgi:hypothetical protein
MKKTDVIIPALILALVIGLSCSKSSPSTPVPATPTSIPTSTPTPVCTYTFGETGYTSMYLSGGYVAATEYYAPGNVTLTSLSFYAGGSSHCVAGIYSDNAGAPGALLRQTAVVDCAAGWNETAITPLAVTPGAPYWLAASAYDDGNSIKVISSTAPGKYYARTWSEVQSSGLGEAAVWTDSGVYANSLYATGCHSGI